MNSLSCCQMVSSEGKITLLPKLLWTESLDHICNIASNLEDSFSLLALSSTYLAYCAFDFISLLLKHNGTIKIMKDNWLDILSSLEYFW